eukprot:NODE_3094_length_423_cov_247.283422_g2580_i0.p1 GENE.NODE_3094_length_423_cov_247.283422_g2580_i0~~NODE_3094_length_423_cov_247.283422_g2580_i0.p1  ORF type:complete len:83 (-),score=20.81 NODE_3094_length_423_cov_247.283422_g2580_i0:115-363(-)
MLVTDPHQRITLQGIIHHPWFQVGFDMARLPQDDIVEPGDDEVRSSIRDLPEPATSVDPDDEPSPAAASVPSGAAGKAPADD